MPLLLERKRIIAPAGISLFSSCFFRAAIHNKRRPGAKVQAFYHVLKEIAMLCEKMDSMIELKKDRRIAPVRIISGGNTT